MQETLTKYVTNHPIELIMTEWALHENIEITGMKRALTVAEAAGKFITSGVSKANYWPLRCGGIHNKKGLIDVNDGSKHANYYVMQQMANNIGNTVVPSFYSSNSGLYIL